MADNDKTFKDILESINNYIENNREHLNDPTDKQLAQFRKSYFYNNWLTRFRHIAAFTPLGTRGVIAIPNTTFEEWLWWFQEWARAFEKDYNEFKKLVYEALLLHEKHLELHDQQIKELNDRVNENTEHIKELQDHVKQLQDQVNNIENIVNQLKGNNDKLIQDLINSGAWEGSKENGNLKPGRNIATGNINLFGGATDGTSFIRTNNNSSENDITAGI